jgi:hypothetical protein
VRSAAWSSMVVTCMCKRYSPWTSSRLITWTTFRPAFRFLVNASPCRSPGNRWLQIADRIRQGVRGSVERVRPLCRGETCRPSQRNRKSRSPVARRTSSAELLHAIHGMIERPPLPDFPRPPDPIDKPPPDIKPVPPPDIPPPRRPDIPVLERGSML